MHEQDLVVEFGSFHEALETFAHRLSEEGIFLETTEPVEVGSQVRFEVGIRDSFSILKGEGQIVDRAPDGVLVRTLSLDDASYRLLPRILEHYRRHGVGLLELPEVPPLPRLTLDDLEAELRSEVDVEPEAAARDRSRLDDTEGPYREADRLLVEAEVLGHRPLEDASAEVEDLMAGKEPPAHLTTHFDDGLPWLPEEPEKSRGRDLWLTVLLVLLGATLGAAFYWFVIRSDGEASIGPVSAESASVETRQVPPAIVEPAAHQEEADTGHVQAAQPAAAVAESPAAAGELPAAPASGTLTGLDRITWAAEVDRTVVTLWADGSFQDVQVDDFRVDGERPREVVRIRGVRRPFGQERIELGTDHVRQIRTGLHEEGGVISLHIVADLVDGEVELLRTEAVGDQLRVYFSKSG